MAWREGVPEVLVMSGAVKIFTLNTALWDMSSQARALYHSLLPLLPYFLPFLSFLPPFPPDFPSAKVGQHYTSIQRREGGREGKI